MEEFILIKQGKWKAEVAPGCGGNLISLAYDEQPILRRPADMQTLKSSPCLYGLPLLLPANRVKDACFEFRGMKYELPMNEPIRSNHLHGLLNKAAFAVQEVTENCVTTALENRGEYYPFPFEATISDRLTDDGLVRELQLRNTGDTPMPYTMAFHAAFAEPKCFCVPVEHRYVVDDRMIPTGQLRMLTAEELHYRTGMDPRSGAVTGFYTSNGDTVQLDDFCVTVSHQFDNWVLFNGGGGQNFLCIEPQCGAVDGLNNGRCKILQPGATEIFTLRIYKKTGETG